jgi:methionyl aminopeptidase
MDKEIVESYLKAGRIAAQIKTYAREMIKPGMKLIDIARKIDDKIIELGGEFGFPVNLSIDEVAAHFTPAEGCELVAEGLLKFDVGVTINGYFADTAFPIDLTEDKRHKDLIEMNVAAQEEVIKTVKPGIKVKEIGAAVSKVLKEWNKEKGTKFSLIHGLSGHEVGQNRIHAGLSIPNYENENENELRDTAFAVEPFITTGSGEIYSGEGGGIYSLQKGGGIRDTDSRKVVEYIKETYKTRPFCKRWLERAGFTKLNYIFSILKKQGVFYEYPLLIEKTKAPVSQVENLFVISDNKVYCTTKE